MSDDAEREYIEAKAAYDAALVRLAAATRGWVKYQINRLLHERRFGPETPDEYEMRVWFEGTLERFSAEHEAKLAMARAVPIELLGHSEAWHQAYQMYENQRKAAEQSEE